MLCQYRHKHCIPHLHVITLLHICSDAVTEIVLKLFRLPQIGTVVKNIKRLHITLVFIFIYYRHCSWMEPSLQVIGPDINHIVQTVNFGKTAWKIILLDAL